MADHTGHRDRLRKEFMARPESFPDHKVLELLLFYVLPRQDTNPLAHDLLDRFGSLQGVLDAPPQALAQVKGVGDRAAVLFRAVKELGRRYSASRAILEHIVDSTRAAREVFEPLFYGARNEMVYLLCMDGKSKYLGCPKVGEGNVNAAEITARSIVEAALNHNAARVILAHNHVSGVAVFSSADVRATRELRELLRQVHVELVDHFVVAANEMVSMVASGYLDGT